MTAPGPQATADLDLATLPAKPKIAQGGYGWTGALGDLPCLALGHRELDFDKAEGALVFDSRRWDGVAFSATQKPKLARFMEVAAEAGDWLLIYVYEDVGMDTTATGEHMARRGPKRLTGLFRVTERGEGWFRAVLKRRD
ncbi:MAG: hypothetical protein VYD87_01155 [Pseudomonadota bacterium]|nr:hypothetical protein [Pseudomonadota bacterium]